jgi:hypothetical protein
VRCDRFHVTALSAPFLKVLQRLFLLEASEYKVFPLDDRSVERFGLNLAGDPEPSSPGTASSGPPR